ncbi:IS1634 family transposase [Desulfobacter hydrogenophilus]|uniref:IS1634 family transposase n=1 Tax=Desulfobacter hydrogenophilus TaxID=2291 RepID=A0A328F9U4_9BACT|nr:IS1634 family transposase [Desulfobacter hydrogenophilus]QBH14120.1 IS1634 family transposase [Desulfobacter hydrogenophilus]RAL99806.1 IS1634 family transposase [Desulfobacter hydrogenophilus]
MTTDSTSKDQEIFNKDKLQIITERVDDVPLLIAQMLRMGIPEIIDRHIPRHGNQRDLSWGWTTVIWMAYILTEGDHRKVSMSEYVEEMQNTLLCIAGRPIVALDFSDDRLAHLLKHLSNREYWSKIEDDLNKQSIEVYDLKPETIRCDATTVSADQAITEDGLVQFGHSKDNTKLPQIKLMSAALDPLGMPLASDVVSGEKADDGLYIPLISRVSDSLKKNGLLFSGDCKMSALETRAHLLSSGHHYLCPLPLTGKTADEMKTWINEGISKDQEKILIPVFRENYKGIVVLAAKGYEFSRIQTFQKKAEEITWPERVFVVHSPAHARQQSAGLNIRLTKAKEKLEKLTPLPGRGRRQISDEAELVAAIAKIIKAHNVEDLLEAQFEKQVEQKMKYVGKGRGGVNRETIVVEKVRYQITSVERNQKKIADEKTRFGWKAFVTEVDFDKLSLHDAILSYRNEYRVERIFGRLKSRLNIAPLFVKKDDQIEGMTYLLTLCVRVLTLIEFVVRRSLKEEKTELPDMHPENHKKTTAKPSAEKILKAFSKVNLTIICDMAGNVIMRSLKPLSNLQKQIIQKLGLDSSIYTQLEI